MNNDNWNKLIKAIKDMDQAPLSPVTNIKSRREVYIKARRGQRRVLGEKIVYLKGFRKGAEIMRKSYGGSFYEK